MTNHTTWTTTKPDRPGWWFWRKRKCRLVNMCFISECEGQLYATPVFGTTKALAGLVGWWSSEPIPEPTERDERETQP